MIIPHKLYPLQISSINILITIDHLLPELSFKLSHVSGNRRLSLLWKLVEAAAQQREALHHEDHHHDEDADEGAIFEVAIFHFPLKIFDSGVFEATFCSQITLGIQEGTKVVNIGQVFLGDKKLLTKKLLFSNC